MSGLDLSNLSGADAAVALRSYPRRFREAIEGSNPVEAEAIAAQIGPSGRSPLDLVVNTANTAVLLGRALHDVLVSDEPVLHAGVLDADERQWEVPPGTTLDGAFARLREETTALADAVGKVHGDQWARPGRVAGGSTITALDLVREAVRAGADNLRAADAAMQALRRP